MDRRSQLSQYARNQNYVLSWTSLTKFTTNTKLRSVLAVKLGSQRHHTCAYSTIYWKRILHRQDYLSCKCCFFCSSIPTKANDLVYYGQYKTTQKPILKLMKSLTNNQFKFGAISQIVIRDFWRTGSSFLLAICSRMDKSTTGSR